MVGQFLSYEFKSSIDPRLKDRGFTPAQMKALMDKLKSQSARTLTTCGLQFTGDLDDFQYNHFDFVIEMYESYNEHGVLPFSGAHADQPAQIMEIFQIISQLYQEKNTRLHKQLDKGK